MGRGRRRRDVRQLLQLGFTEDDLARLFVLEQRRLAKWTVSTYEFGFMLFGLGYGVVLGAVVFLGRWSSSAGLLEAVLVALVCVGLGVWVGGLGGARTAYWVMCLLDRYQSFGDAAARILRWIRPPVTQRLAVKERCLRLTRRWAAQGRRNGLELSGQEQRILDILAGELTPTAIEEIHDIVRGSLLDAATSSGFNPNTYEVGKLRTLRQTLRLVGEVAGVITVASAVVASVLAGLEYILR
ncbi:hypothetical protein GCM10010413_07060 [Promicromonospora sukumoe]